MSTDAKHETVNPEVTQMPTKGEPVTSPPQVSIPKKSFIRMRWQRFRGWLCWLFPNWSAVNWSDHSYERLHDAEENEKTLVPTDLELRVPAVWGCELYGPEEINDLYTGLQRLGWGIAYRVGDKDGIEKWIRQNRAYGRQGGWLNGGHVVGCGEQNKYTRNSNHTSLPNGVLSLDVEVFQLSPSLTGVLVRFRLDDTVARRYEDEINRERVTYRRRIPRSTFISIVGPMNQKHDEVARVRSALRRLVADWYKQHLPGYFSAQDRGTVFPIMELLAVKEGPILHRPLDTSRETGLTWRWLLNQASPPLVWTSQENNGIQLVMGDDAREDEQGRFITVAIDETRFSEESMKVYGGKSSNSLTHICGEVLRYVLPHAAIMGYLKEQTRYLNINREQLNKARSGRANLSRTLLAISQFFDHTLGVPALARELAEKSKSPRRYCRDIGFTAPGWGSQETPRQLSEDFQLSTHIMASRLTKDEVAMRGHFEQLSSILSIHESIKVQRRMQFLTVLAVAVAVLSLLVALAGSHTVAEWFKSIWTNDFSSF